MKFKILFTTALLGLTSISAFPWGQKGHDTVAYIAECHLTPTTAAAVSELLDGKSIVYWSNWMDSASHTPEYEWSRTWHYKNIDADKTFENAPKIKEGDVVRALEEQTAILTNPEATQSEKNLALKMIVHFVGDIHQPLHLGHASDRGGNSWIVRYFNKDTNIHSVWDSSLPESAHKWSYTEWQQQIDRLPEEKQQEIIKDGNPSTWGKETFEICKEVYDRTPRDSRLSFDYISEWTPVVENQFLKGGLRLADLLNSAFDPDYTPGNNFVVRK